MLLIESIAKVNFTTLETFKKKSPVLEQVLLSYLAAGVLGKEIKTHINQDKRVTSILCVLCWRENEVEEVKDEGPKEMTLDEWKAMQDKERAKVEFDIRKVKDDDWNKGFVLHKSKAEVSQIHPTGGF